MSQNTNQWQILLALQCLLFTTAVSLNTARVLRRTQNQKPDRDAFNNPSCKPSDCPANSNCLSNSCCTCHCTYSYPNFLVKRWACRSNADTTKVNSNFTCAFSIRAKNEPIEVLLTTEEERGKIKLTSSNDRVNCNNDVTVDRWDYLDAHDQWIRGQGNVYSVLHSTVGGSNQTKKDLTFLQWTSRLDSRYSGLLIRVWLHCKSNSQRIGCLLAKLNGTYTYDTTSTTISVPATRPSPTSKHGSNNGDPTSPSSNTAGQQVLVTHKQEQQSSTSIGPIVGLVAGVLVLLCLIIVLIIIAYRKRRTCLPCITKKKYQRDSVVNAETYQESSIYAEVPGAGPDFDNPVYSDPATGNLNRRSKQDPLPVIPGSESSYQTLNELTRTTAVSEPPPPPLPPISYPMGNDNKASDYEGRIPIQAETKDYENPSTTHRNNSEKKSSNYDNPPQATKTDSSLIEPSGYDNPPQTSPPIKSEQGVEDSSSVNTDAEDCPEYFVLESENTGI